MQLDEAQKQKVKGWIAEGRQLSEIQKLLETEFNMRLTYLDVRLLVDDLKVVPKDLQRPEVPKTVLPSAAPAPGKEGLAGADQPPPGPAGGVSVTVDAVARPGAMVSGGVTFSDGQKAMWYVDELGRLGLAPQQQGYRPSAEDLQEFQLALRNELQSYGF